MTSTTELEEDIACSPKASSTLMRYLCAKEGTEMGCDIGLYRDLRAEKERGGPLMTEAIEEGKVEVWMDGKKLQGGFALIRTGREEPRWLLLKMDTEQTIPDPDVAGTESDTAIPECSLKKVTAQEG